MWLWYFDPATLLTFGAACVALFITPGPGLMFICANGVASGSRVGVAAAIGTALGAGAQVVLAAAGVAALVAANPLALVALRWIGAAYLLWIAVQSWRAKPAQAQKTKRRTIYAALRRGVLTNLLNPKVMLFVLAFLPQFIDPARGPVGVQMLLLGAVMVPVGLVFDGLAGWLSGRIGARIAQNAAAANWLNKISALAFGALAARLAIN